MPVLAATLSIFWFATIAPNSAGRVLVASVAWAFYLFFAARCLINGEGQHARWAVQY